MTDLEITRLCAEAMGIDLKTRRVMHRDLIGGSVVEHTEQYREKYIEVCDYNPLHDDAQAMALVKKFLLQIGSGEKFFTVACFANGIAKTNTDLNRAICECVAKMQAGK